MCYPRSLLYFHYHAIHIHICLTFVFLLNYDNKVQLQVLKTNMFCTFLYLQYIHRLCIGKSVPNMIKLLSDCIVVKNNNLCKLRIYFQTTVYFHSYIIVVFGLSFTVLRK